jgi:hypothetical protein
LPPPAIIAAEYVASLQALLPDYFRGSASVALAFHPQLRTRLANALAENFPRIRVEKGMFLDYASSVDALAAAEDALPEHGPVKNQLISYVDEYPITEFVRNWLTIELYELDRYRGDSPPHSLLEIPEFADAHALADRMISELESLPWRYTFTLKLPAAASSAFPIPFVEHRFSTNMRLVRAGESFTKEYPLNSDHEGRQKRIHGGGSVLFPKAQQIEWEERAVYLQIEAEGFVGPYGGTIPAVQVEQQARSFFGLGIATYLFQIEHPFSFGFALPPEHFFVHKWDGKAWKIDNKIDLGTALSRGINAIKLFSFRQLDTESRKGAWIRRCLDNITIPFSSGEKGAPILLAGQWLYDSSAGQDELLNFIQAMVVLEILLGDKSTSDEIGLGQLLRNRCAYLIGQNHAEREMLLRRFDEIYRVRSQIVHRGKARLNSTERSMYAELKRIGLRVIEKEIELLKAEKKS